MKLSKHIFLMLGIATVFSFGYVDMIVADTCDNCTAGPAKGRYCQKKNHKHDCPYGCYCDGNKKTATCDELHNNLANICRNKNPSNLELTKMSSSGIHLCPQDKPYSWGKESAANNCFSKTCNGNMPEGKYCRSKAGYEPEKKLCPTGCYCKGSSTSTKAIGYTDTFISQFCNGATVNSETLSVFNNQGIYTCPAGFKTLSSGKSAISDCKATLDNGDTISYLQNHCESGQYLPKKSNTCTTCKTGHVCSGGDFYTNLTRDQGICAETDTFCLRFQRGVGGTYQVYHLVEEENNDPRDPMGGITCNDGFYLPALSETCAECVAGYYCLGRSYLTGTNPDTGQHYDGQDRGLTPCEDGTWSAAGATHCTACGTGLTSNPGHTGCVPAPTYTVTYTCGDGTGTPPAAQQVMLGNTFTPSQNNTCAKSGFNFADKWQVQDGNDIFNVGGQYTWSFSANKTLVAQWEEVQPDEPQDSDVFHVTYDCGTGNGTAPTDNGNYSSGYEVTAKIGTGCGSTFQNWLCGSNNYNPGESFTITADTTCTAQYSTTQQQTNCTITYNCDNGGLNQGPVVTEQNGQFQLKASSVCTAPSDMVFDKWKESVNGSESAAGGAFNCTGSDLTFIAIWRPYDPATNVPCGEGYYLPANEENCALCTAGSACPGGTYIKNYPADQGINQCVGNTFTSTTGATVCLNCPAGMGANATNTSCDGSGTGTYMTVPAGHYIPVGASTYMPCTDALVSYYNFCPGGQFLTNQSTPQGLFTCLDGGTAINNHTSCRVRLSEERLKHGFNGLECWKIDPIVYPTAYKNCVFSGTNQAAQ